MKSLNIGESKLVRDTLAFLIDDYRMSFSYNVYDEFLHFKGPIYCYSFYNEYGCFTIQHIKQRGEIGWFVSNKYSDDQYELLKKEINQKLYPETPAWTFKSHLSQIALAIKIEIKTTNSLFGIRIS